MKEFDKKGSDKNTRNVKESQYNKEVVKKSRYSKEVPRNDNANQSSKDVKTRLPKATEVLKEVIEKNIREDLIEGRNAVIEALRGDRTIEQIFIAKGDTEGSINVVKGLAKEKGIVVKEVDRKKLDSMSETGSHQGVVAMVTPYNYFQIEDILDLAKTKNESPFIVILDEIEDPHNFGSIIRTAEVCGVHGIIIPKRRNVGITPTVYKSSAGAVEHMKIAKVTNLNTAIETLKKNGVWIYGADMEGKEFSHQINFEGAVAVVIGSEGSGISKLTKGRCDKLVKIPMIGKINSLNASVAAGILMYEVMKQKLK